MIEKDLGRIADALEIIAGVMDDKHADAGKESVAGKVPLPLEEQADAPTDVPTPPATTTAAPAPEAPVPEAPMTATEVAARQHPQLTVEELNTALVTEYHRLGQSREGIDKVLIKHGGVDSAGAGSVNTLTPDKYQIVLDEIKAIK